MEQQSTICNQTQYRSALKNVMLRISELKNIQQTISVRSNSVIFFTKLQSFFNLKFSNPFEKMIYEIILFHGLHAEQLSPRGFDLFIENVLRYYYEVSKGIPLKDVIKPLQVTQKAQTTVAKKGDIEWLIEKYSSTYPEYQDEVSDIFRYAINLAGFHGNISIEKTSNINSVEMSSGFKFNLSPKFKLANKVIVNAKILCIDGYIESVSEIHHILENAASSNDDLILFNRGLSDDVIHTLKINYLRGKLKVIPIQVPFDIKGINTIKDLCVVTGSSPVSSDLGHLINSIDYNKLKTVRKVTILNEQIIIHDNNNQKEVAIHLKSLRNKRKSVQSDDQRLLYDLRIKSLMSNYVTIRLKDDPSFVIKSQMLDYMLRAFRSLVRYGLTTCDGKKILKSTEQASNKATVLCLTTLIDSTTAIIIDES